MLDNTYGVDLEGADASVYDTTIAGNSNTGLILDNYEVSLGSDTISNNRIGVTAPSGGSAMQIVDTVVAGNTFEDCSQVSDWEFGDGFEPGSFGNLVGSFSCPIDQGTAHGDVRDTTLTSANMPAVGLNGGPTPSILPPSSAQAMDTPSCGLGGVDQREFRNPSSSTYDAGATQQGASSATSLAIGALDLGTVAVGSTRTGAGSLSNWAPTSSGSRASRSPAPAGRSRATAARTRCWSRRSSRPSAAAACRSRCTRPRPALGTGR